MQVPSRPTPRRRHMRASEKRRWRTLGIWVVSSVVLSVMAFFLVLDLGNSGIKSFPESYIVRSGSMAPVIDTGSLVIDTRVSPSTPIKPGDIVTFVNPIQTKTLLTHQIIGLVHKNQTMYIQTKGTANKMRDPFLTPESNIVGVYRFSIPGLGYLIVYMKRYWLWELETLGGLTLIYILIIKVILPERKGAKP